MFPDKIRIWVGFLLIAICLCTNYIAIALWKPFFHWIGERQCCAVLCIPVLFHTDNLVTKFSAGGRGPNCWQWILYGYSHSNFLKDFSATKYNQVLENKYPSFQFRLNIIQIPETILLPIIHFIKIFFFFKDNLTTGIKTLR